MLKFILLITALQAASALLLPLFDGKPCELEANALRPLMTFNGKVLIPSDQTSVETFTIPSGEAFTLSCQPGQFSNLTTTTTELEATCVSGKFINLQDTQTNFDTLECDFSDVSESMLTPFVGCNDTGIKIGFKREGFQNEIVTGEVCLSNTGDHFKFIHMKMREINGREDFEEIPISFERPGYLASNDNEFYDASYLRQIGEQMITFANDIEKFSNIDTELDFSFNYDSSTYDMYMGTYINNNDEYMFVLVTANSKGVVILFPQNESTKSATPICTNKCKEVIEEKYWKTIEGRVQCCDYNEVKNLILDLPNFKEPIELLVN